MENIVDQNLKESPKDIIEKVGFGGGCHWCTEAIFLSLKGVSIVEQGWISSVEMDCSFSEGVVVHFDPNKIDLPTLISIHLHTHSCTTDHKMRNKYRSAVYTYSKSQSAIAKAAIEGLKNEFDKRIVTRVIPYQSFKPNTENYIDYYYSKPDMPFCQSYISPKLKLLLSQFSKVVNREKLSHLE